MPILHLPKTATAERRAFYRHRIDNLAAIVKSENWDVSDADIPREQKACRDRLAEMTVLADLFKAGKSRHVFAWRALAEFVLMHSVRGLTRELRSYKYFVVFGLGDRDVDAPFENGEETRRVKRDLIRMAQQNPEWMQALAEELSPHTMRDAVDEFQAWREKYPLFLTVSKPVSLQERALTQKEVDQILAFNTSVQPVAGGKGRVKWSIRVPTDADRLRYNLPHEAVWLRARELSAEGAAWHVIVDNPEMLDLPEKVPAYAQPIAA